jgi:hypothetical protein
MRDGEASTLATALHPPGIIDTKKELSMIGSAPIIGKLLAPSMIASTLAGP